jgi:hypothetical protein
MTDLNGQPEMTDISGQPEMTYISGQPEMTYISGQPEMTWQRGVGGGGAERRGHHVGHVGQEAERQRPREDA